MPPKPSTDAFGPDGTLRLQDDLDAFENYKAALVAYDAERAAYNEAISGVNSGLALQKFLKEAVRTEIEAIEILTKLHSALELMDNESISNGYFLLVEKFLEKFSLRYEIRRPFSLHPSPSGVYAALYAEIVAVCQSDAALAALLRDFREAFQDLQIGATPGRINTCLQKQVNLLEGLASSNRDVTEKTLGKMCGQLHSWPSTAVSEAVKSLYGFASDHTGLRHGTIKKAKHGKTPVTYRDMEMRDLVAVTTVFTGLATYLSDQLDPMAIYGV